MGSTVFKEHENLTSKLGDSFFKDLETGRQVTSITPFTYNEMKKGTMMLTILNYKVHKGRRQFKIICRLLVIVDGSLILYD